MHSRFFHYQPLLHTLFRQHSFHLLARQWQKRQHKLVEHRLQQALRISLITGGWSVVILYVFASPVLTLMYGSDSATAFIQLLAPCFFISLFSKSTYLCFTSFKLSTCGHDEYVYWCNREINRYFRTSFKARVSNDGGLPLQLQQIS